MFETLKKKKSGTIIQNLPDESLEKKIIQLEIPVKPISNEDIVSMRKLSKYEILKWFV